MSALIEFRDRPADSPFVERVWESRSARAGSFHSMAACHWVMVVTRHEGRTFLTIRGPETRASLAECPAGGEWVGIHFKLGSFMPQLPLAQVSDRHDLTLPGNGRSFRLDGSNWAYPGFENAEAFVARLARRGLVTVDPAILAALAGAPARKSHRTEQRHFLRATGMTQGTLRQIERAREATVRLRAGGGIADVAYDLGYSDQAHLTRSLRRFIGQTPAQVARQEGQLSFLFNSG
jgi:AraC-like DNA-binding protein